MKSMMLITSTWGKSKTFKLIPVTPDAPYNEGIYDPTSGVLALIGINKKQGFHMVPKLTDQGDLMHLKVARRENGKDYAEERKMLETYYEYYVEEAEEIKSFVHLLAVNSTTFEFEDFMQKKEQQVESPSLITH